MHYRGNILVYSNTEEQKQHFEEVLAMLAKQQLNIKPSECLWGKEGVPFCGHQVGHESISIAPSKIATVFEWETRQKTCDIQSFL
ncbi:hypothetical protein SYNPS1DRAFT_13800 [Syncephalis pseudoplumigaleata]|uniref:Uncharacterized protein n=2 Tax=Zoopagomycota TaxID=1913638 RepID=A0A4P9ZMK7_9FUNG|nr:hypothetical protein SYNPS1DRAFT_13800 [Syncephalis pseudoplumigaleata]RKP34453.1 hypothetical protein BJ085DRAFT_15603 [Dimargaris cristalligena]|eukprot:RKP26717.1 hypothetical protein SYNPS1DRAFT_13800 [Syncephalis pseudoplumigaleata]